jgi:glutamate racemase
MARLPNESFVYLGDTARLPYGTKSAETVLRYAVQAAKFLTKRQVKLIVVACNTASAVALPALEKALAPLPIVGVIAPGAQAAVAAAGNEAIAVLATEATVKGGAYLRAIHALAPNAMVTQQACPLFVSLAEEGLIDGAIAELAVGHYLEPLFAQAEPRALLLGCTHFPVLAPVLARWTAQRGMQVALVDSAATTADAVAKLLTRSGLASRSPSGLLTFLATDAPERFARVGEIFLGHAPEDVELVDLQAG